MQHSSYHRILRISSLVCAVALVFESGVLSESNARVSMGTHAYLASAIGMSVSVQPTELSQYTAELTTIERDLATREASLREREISIGLTSGSQNNDTATYVLASILFILLVLILLNYALDYLRVREEQSQKTV
jgi:hypothetical protein